jgi:hypothetical protein
MMIDTERLRELAAERIRDGGGEQRLERVELVAGQQVVDHDEAVRGGTLRSVQPSPFSLIVALSR